MAGEVVGQAYVEILPELKRFNAEFSRALKQATEDMQRTVAQLGRQIGDASRHVGASLGQGIATGSGDTLRRQLPESITRGTGDVGPVAVREGSRHGRSFGSSLVSGVTSTIGGVVSHVQSVLGAAASVVRSAAGGIALAFGGAAVAGGTIGIKTAASLEQAQIAFAQLLHSGQAAQKFLSDLSTFAATTPFELPGLISSARQLIGAGEAAKNVIPTLTAWGDATGALGVGQEAFQRIMIAVTQSMNKGKVQAEELMQITEAGIPVYPLLAKALNKPVPELQKLSSEGKLLAKDVFPALERQMHKDYGGAMAKQSQTLTGLWSTFMDTLNIGLSKAIQPLIPALKTGLTGAINALGGALRIVGVGVNATFSFIGKSWDVLLAAFRTGEVNARSALGPVGTAIGFIGINVRRIADVFMRNVIPVFITAGRVLKDRVLPGIQGIFDLIVHGDFTRKFADAFNVSEDSPIVARMLHAREVVISTARDIVAALRNMWTDISSGFRTGITDTRDALSPLSGTFQRIGVFAHDFMQVFNAIADGIRRNFLPTVRDVASFLYRTFAPTFRAIVAVIQRNLIPMFQQLRGTISNNLPQLITLAKFIGAVIAVVVALALRIAGFLLPIFIRVTGVITTVVIGTGLRVLITVIGATVRAVEGLVRGFIWLWTNTQKLWAAITATVRLATNVISGFISGLRNRIISMFTSAGRWLVGAGRGILGGLWDGIKAVWTLIIDWFTGRTSIQRRIVGLFAHAGEWLLQAGKNIMTGLWDGLKAVWTDVRNWFADLPKKFLHAIGIASPPKWAIEAGQHIMSGMLKGLAHNAANVKQYFTDLVHGIYSIFTGPAVTTPGDPGVLNANAKMGEDMARSFGWIGQQWQALYSLWWNESKWNNLAKNPSSTAFGIPQFLAGTAKQYGVLGITDPARQISAGMQYIRDVYGSPLAALQAWMSRTPHWYATGAWRIPAQQLAVLHRGEMVVPEAAANIVRSGVAQGSSDTRINFAAGAIQVIGGNGVNARELARLVGQAVTDALDQRARQSMKGERR